MTLVNGFFGVERVVVAHEEGAPMQRVGSRLGEYLDASVAELVELRGKRILVDANLTDGGFGRQLAAGESVDVNLAAVGSGRWAGQGRQFVGELVGIVGERIEIATLEHEGAGIGAGLGADRRRSFVGDDHLLLGLLDSHLDVDVFRLACAELNG